MINCLMCTKSFKDRAHLANHMVTHTKEKPFKCITCSATFALSDNLKIHVKGVHEGVRYVYKSRECPLCNQKILSNNLKRHLRTHSAELLNTCNIIGCSFKTKYKTTLAEHYRQDHPDVSPYECPEAGCHYKSQSKRKLNDHLKVHSSAKPFAFVCKVAGCDYGCKLKSSLAAHTKAVHAAKTLYKCATCRFRTNYKRSLKRHQNVHGNTERFQCQAPNCGFASHHRENLKRHFDYRHRSKDVSCTAPGCNYRCGSKTILKIHLKQHELPTLQCPANSCKFRTRFKGHLLGHISGRHDYLQSASVLGPGKLHPEVAGAAGQTDQINCRFPNCGYKTRNPHHYDRHRITHDEGNKRRHVCTFCYSRFSHLHCLKDHVKRHTGEKPFRCSHCEYSAVTSVELSRHAWSSHHIYLIPCGKDNEMRKCGTCSESFWSNNEFVLHTTSHLQAVVVLKKINLKMM